MALKTADRVRETSVTTGTGEYTLDGAPTGFQAFSTMTANNTCPYFATDDVNWEVGIGTILSGPARLQRTTILASSNGGSAVNWGAGTKNIMCGYPAAFFNRGLVARTSNTSLSASDFAKTIIASTTFTQDFDSSANLGDGWRVNYRNDGSGLITLDPGGSETIDGASSLTLFPGDSCTIYCDGSNLKTVGLGRPQFKAGSTTRDLSLATGTQNVTGVGFAPRAVFLLGAVDNTAAMSFGIMTSAAAGSVADMNVLTAGAYRPTTDVLRFYTGSGGPDFAQAAFGGFNNDGFDLSWTKNGSPTGTATIYYLALR